MPQEHTGVPPRGSLDTGQALGSEPGAGARFSDGNTGVKAILRQMNDIRGWGWQAGCPHAQCHLLEQRGKTTETARRSGVSGVPSGWGWEGGLPEHGGLFGAVEALCVVL